MEKIGSKSLQKKDVVARHSFFEGVLIFLLHFCLFCPPHPLSCHFHLFDGTATAAVIRFALCSKQRLIECRLSSSVLRC